jgi:Protein of unknown function (DUF3305)
MRPALDVSVIMRREPIVGAMSRWQTHRWVLENVILAGEATSTLVEKTASKLTNTDKNNSTERWIHAGYRAELFSDDAEGYYLNVTTDAPCWFVLWRMEEEAGITHEPIETVEQVPLPPDVIAWLKAFVDEHHVIETKKRKRPESFKRLEDRFGNPVSITTEKKMGGSFNHG